MKPGTPVLLREIYRGRVWAARPHVVVEQRSLFTALCIPAGTTCKLPADAHGNLLRMQPEAWKLSDVEWTGGVLRLHTHGAAHSLILWWRDDAFQGWYVNLEEPWRASRFGWDYLDHKLDLIIWPDGSWEWKDEDELDQAVTLGILSAQEAREARDEGERVLAQFEVGASPFRDGWENWRPNPAWSVPELPAGWDRV